MQLRLTMSLPRQINSPISKAPVVADPDQAGPAIIDRITAVRNTVALNTVARRIMARRIMGPIIAVRAIMTMRIADQIEVRRTLATIDLAWRGAQPSAMTASHNSNGNLTRCNASCGN